MKKRKIKAKLKRLQVELTELKSFVQSTHEALLSEQQMRRNLETTVRMRLNNEK